MVSSDRLTLRLVPLTIGLLWLVTCAPAENESLEDLSLPNSVTVSEDPLDLPVWVVGEPDFSMETDEGGSGSAPFLERVLGGHWLSDGRIVVVDGFFRMQLYAEDGTHLRTLGGRGEGPSEFSFIRSVSITSEDSIVAYDGPRHAAKVFHPDAGFVRSEVIGMPERASVDAQVLRTRAGYLRLANVLEGFDVDAALEGLRPGEIRSIRQTAVLHLFSNGQIVAGPVEFPGTSSGLVGELSIIQPLAAVPQFASRDDLVVYSAGDSFTLVQLDARLSPRLEIRWPAFSGPFTTEELSSVRDRMVEENMFRSEFLSDELVPEERPSTQRLLVDRQCRIWASQFEAQLRFPREREWFVLDRAGVPIARLVLPDEEGVQLLDVDGDRILLGRLVGPAGEPSVQIARISGDGSLDPSRAGAVTGPCAPP